MRTPVFLIAQSFVSKQAGALNVRMAHRIVSVLLMSSRQVQQHLIRSLDLFLKHRELGGMGLGPIDERAQRWKQRLSKRCERILDTWGRRRIHSTRHETLLLQPLQRLTEHLVRDAMHIPLVGMKIGMDLGKERLSQRQTALFPEAVKAAL